MKKEMEFREKEICMANILTVYVGTNFPQGGDAGHGGRTMLRFDSHGGSTDMRVIVDGHVSYPAGEVIIDFLGDSEGVSLLRALLFAASALAELMI